MLLRCITILITLLGSIGHYSVFAMSQPGAAQSSSLLISVDSKAPKAAAMSINSVSAEKKQYEAIQKLHTGLALRRIDSLVRRVDAIVKRQELLTQSTPRTQHYRQLVLKKVQRQAQLLGEAKAQFIMGMTIILRVYFNEKDGAEFSDYFAKIPESFPVWYGVATWELDCLDLVSGYINNYGAKDSTGSLESVIKSLYYLYVVIGGLVVHPLDDTKPQEAACIARLMEQFEGKACVAIQPAVTDVSASGKEAKASDHNDNVATLPMVDIPSMRDCVYAPLDTLVCLLGINRRILIELLTLFEPCVRASKVGRLIASRLMLCGQYCDISLPFNNTGDYVLRIEALDKEQMFEEIEHFSAAGALSSVMPAERYAIMVKRITEQDLLCYDRSPQQLFQTEAMQWLLRDACRYNATAAVERLCVGYKAAGVALPDELAAEVATIAAIHS